MLYKSLSGQLDYIFIRNLCDKTENIIETKYQGYSINMNVGGQEVYLLMHAKLRNRRKKYWCDKILGFPWWYFEGG